MRLFEKKTLFSSLSLLFVLLLSQPLKAQDYDYTDTELINFGKVLVEVITIQQNTQREMIAIIQENNLSIPRFNEMMGQAQEKGEDKVEGTKVEKEAFKVVADALNGIQERMIDDLTKAVVAKGMTLERYESILADYQADAKLQEKIHALAE